jgi:hypothetical protein
VVALVIVVLDESNNGLLKLPVKVMVFQTNHILDGAMPALNFA